MPVSDLSTRQHYREASSERGLVGSVMWWRPLSCLSSASSRGLQMAHDALNAPLHILRAIYELQMKRTDSFFLEVQKR